MQKTEGGKRGSIAERVAPSIEDLKVLLPEKNAPTPPGGVRWEAYDGKKRSPRQLVHQLTLLIRTSS